ncbi:MAG: late competence development ComFB family protein, partial [Lachnospiraceae bacterium]|nr:late competence development ComFB family protein [Lachnospiraceae bacterium]
PAPEAVPAPETSNRTMSADEIAAAFAAAQQPAAEASPSPAPEAVPAPQPAETTSAPADTPTKITPQMVIPKSQISSNLTNDQYHFVNVMEQLILRQDIDNFLEQYNVCKCRRCVSDVCALALSGLPSKYVVTSKDSLSPILSYYESKYRIYMLTELIKACNKVRESPRHKK